MSKEFVLEQIDGYELMDEEEKRYFAMYGREINNQADLIAEENDVNPEEKTEFAYMMNSLSSNRSEYIVHGAPLECTMQEKNGKIQKFGYKGNVISSAYIKNEDDAKLLICEERTETINDKVPANIADTKGGLRDSLKMGRNDETEGKNKLNITSFGNCKCAIEYKEVKELAERLSIELPNVSIDILKEKIKNAIESGYGTCYCMMMLNSRWENIPLGYNWYTESFKADFTRVGAENILGSTPYLQYNGKEGINMMSMLFCKFGGIINSVKSGQDKVDSIWEDYERELLIKFSNEFAYENWSSEKQLCAEELWKRLVEEEGIDPIFVAGLIGNVYVEGAVGMLQNGKAWEELGDLDIGGYDIISNIKQARIVCDTPSGWGVGMIQWSYKSRKEILLSNYELYQSADGNLSLEQLVGAECKTILDELYLGKEKKEDMYTDCKDIYPSYIELEKKKNGVGDKVNFSTCLIFRDYIKSQAISEVEINYTVADGVWEKALETLKASEEEETEESKEFEGVPSICKRIIAAKLIYEHFTGEAQ